MKIKNIHILALAGLISSCALNEPEVNIQDDNFPFRLEIDEEGADLADAEDYGIEIAFADYIGDLPAQPITLSYELTGEGDYAGAAIDEILYVYEEDDCEFEREIAFTANTITIPVDEDMGTVPEEFEIVVLMNESGDDANEDSQFSLSITQIESADEVLFSTVNTFEYEILDNDLAGEWLLEIGSQEELEAFQEVFGPISSDLAELTFADISGEVKFEFEFEEVKIEVELNEEEEVSKCKIGEIETEMENLIVEIEAEYDAEDGELEMEESYFTEDGEELDFIIEAEYELGTAEDATLTFTLVIDEDHYEEGDELFAGSQSFTLIRD
ncbi:hypothetical protein [Reichenbachiella ulvae]|uniref:Calx-beta domain-containing protein n=1 Tax=Reichenbachiella ulvae TaxID=2980104 RepID=A0ABT3CZ77_9BACT|nr:hypothetical protein [Reichenbachiella ulvae]MCV9388819.1 hypothetical protein [Reichenbachiella ulvae]